MATTLTVTASEEGTYIVEAAFTNSDGDAVTPETVTWTLKTVMSARFLTRSQSSRPWQ